jgi:D-serine deaminase-like pyridoxal phosphate-dependent protein
MPYMRRTLIRVEKGYGLEVGDKIEFISLYIDGTINLHEKIYAIRKGQVEAIWSILGRGKSS